MTWSFLRMMSGGAGLLAAFTAISLPLLLSDSASSSLAAGTFTLLAIRILLGAAACLLLWFSLSHAEAYRLLRFHSRPRK
jgi:hypothetical protein